jgi:hypothetical protein
MKKGTVIKVSVVPAILLIGLVAMQGLGATKKQTNRRVADPEPRAVETQRLVFGDLDLSVKGNGVVESERTLSIVSEAGGRVIFAKNDLKDGTFVKAGDVVLKIDSRDVENQLYGLRSDFLNSVASVLPELRLDDAHVYRRWFDYFNSLDIDRPIPDLPEITHPQEKIKVSTKNIIGKYYQVRNQEILLSKYTVAAPFDGFITSSGVIENSFVSMGQQLFTLTDPKNLVVTVMKVARRPASDGLRGRKRWSNATRRRWTSLSLLPTEISIRTSYRAATCTLTSLGRRFATWLRYRATSWMGTATSSRWTAACLVNSPSMWLAIKAMWRSSATPLLGMNIRSINMPDLNVEADLAEADESVEEGIVSKAPGAESVTAGG